MHWTEIAFYIGIVVVIITILLIDLLIFDKESHEVTLKEAFLWSLLWIGLGLGFGVFIYFHGDLIHGIKNIAELREVVNKYEYSVKINPSDFYGSLKAFNHQMALDYITGYLLEKTLSVDNLFVMIMIFASFGVHPRHHKRVLFWGILGAIILRTIFIFIGAALVLKFHWILYLFGIFLLYSGAKVFLKKEEEKIEPQNHPVIRFLSKHAHVFPRYVGGHFFVKPRGQFWHVTPLFLVLVIIEFSDIVFAFDSIPAIFSITLDPFIVFFSNIFAILGLRALYFFLAKVVEKFYALQYGVGLLLIFIGLKLLFAEQLHRLGFENIHSLIFILVVLTVSIAYSLLFPKKEK